MLSTGLMAQEYKVYPSRIIDLDTIPVITYPKVTITARMSPKMRRWYRYHKRLIYNVKKVMPYAKIAADRLKIVDQEMALLETERERKQYYISKEKELRQEFEKDMVKLTFSQGLLLMKLIDRETGRTTYYILKEYRSTINAVFWQSFAKIFGYNLKQAYDPVKDNDIEMVIKMLGYE